MPAHRLVLIRHGERPGRTVFGAGPLGGDAPFCAANSATYAEFAAENG